MKITFVAAAAAFAIAPFAASAVTVTDDSMTMSHTVGESASNSPTFPGPSVLDFGIGFNANLPTGAGWTVPTGSPDPDILPPPGTLSTIYKSPFEGTGLEDSAGSTYFSVGGTGDADGAGPEPDEGAASPAILNFSESLSSIEMLWGSIDTYNTIEFLTGGAGGSVIGSFTGGEAWALTTGADGSDANFATIVAGSATNTNIVGLFSFMATGGASFDAIRFTSTQAAFEFGFEKDFAVTQPIPLPFGFLLLGTAIAGLGFASRRKAA